jgi:hypothetical protein
MEEIRRADKKLLLQELLKANRLVLLVGYLVAAGTSWLVSPWVTVGLWITGLIVWGITSYNAAQLKKFRGRHFELLYQGCTDRLFRFEEVLKKLRKEQIVDLNEMPDTIRAVYQSLYVALRKADMISHEVSHSEQGIAHMQPIWNASPNDPQAAELFRIADKNLAEYRTNYQGVMAGVQRTEAQAAVFMTTLDAIRMKLIGYRLVGKSPEVTSRDFLTSVAEAKLQLEAIDKALDELDFSQYPKTVEIIPPSEQRIGGGA